MGKQLGVEVFSKGEEVPSHIIDVFADVHGAFSGGCMHIQLSKFAPHVI
jgi:hypothetical protein